MFRRFLSRNRTSSEEPAKSEQQRKPTYVLAKPIGRSVEPRIENRSRRVLSTSNGPISKKVESSKPLSLNIIDRQKYDEVQAEKLAAQIISYCRQNRIHFVDDRFPPTDLTLGDIESVDSQLLQWLPISDIIPINPIDQFQIWSVFSSPTPNDIQQGALGDCWLMAALTLITERPEMLDHIVLTKQVNREGVYLIRLCHNGLWKTVLVDDYFPCTLDKHLAFTQAHGRQLYVPLIEKACAKLFGSYGDLISGKTEEGLQLLTGAPCDHIDLDPRNKTIEQDVIWAKLLSAIESGLLINASTGRADVSDSEYNRERIHGNHAFSVLSAHFLSSMSMQFILLRDPHGRSQYVDELLSAANSSKLNSWYPKSQSSGAFWISWAKFLRLFNSITISTYASDYYDVREVSRFTRAPQESIPTFHFHLSKNSLVNISLLYHRENRRVSAKHVQSFVLCNVDQTEYRGVGTSEAIICSQYGNFTHWIGSLRPGFYVLIPFSTTFWTEGSRTPQDYTVVIHSKVQINMQMVREPVTLLSDCLIAAIMKDRVTVDPHQQYKLYTNSSTQYFNILIAENPSLTNYLNVIVDIDDSTQIRHSRRSTITYDSIPPRHRQIIFFVELINESRRDACVRYSFKGILSQEPQKTYPEIYATQNDFHSCRPF